MIYRAHITCALMKRQLDNVLQCLWTQYKEAELQSINSPSICFVYPTPEPIYSLAPNQSIAHNSSKPPKKKEAIIVDMSKVELVLSQLLIASRL